MRRLSRWTFVILLVTTSSAQAEQVSLPWQSTPWSATLYVGPSSTKFLGAVIQSLHLQPSGAMIGLALDGRLFYLGQGISLAAEGQATEYVFGHKDTSFALGLGFQANDIFNFKRTSFSFYTGPSYATDPPFTSIGYSHHIYPSGRVKFLNYIAIEVAVGPFADSQWEGVFRIYHRSGAFGLYSIGDDDGLMLGWGIRRRF
jgi:hypothetical protein